MTSLLCPVILPARKHHVVLHKNEMGMTNVCLRTLARTSLCEKINKCLKGLRQVRTDVSVVDRMDS